MCDLALYDGLAGRRRANPPVLSIATEYDALEEIAVNAGLDVTHQELLPWVWRQVDAGNPRVIRTQLMGLRQKTRRRGRKPQLNLYRAEGGEPDAGSGGTGTGGDLRGVLLGEQLYNDGYIEIGVISRQYLGGGVRRTGKPGLPRSACRE